MSKDLVRVRQLIAIVVDGDPEDASRNEERRTAAVTACRIIHERKLLDSRAARGRRGIIEEASAPGIHVEIRTEEGDLVAEPAPIDDEAEARRQAETDPNVPHCHHCNRRIRWGEQVIFRLGQPMVHVACYPSWKLTVPRHMW